MKSDKVIAWSKPFFEAFISGAHQLVWTKNTLFWTAKSSVQTRLVNGRKQLHCDNGPAFPSAVENLYFLDGNLVPAYAVIEPSWITLSEIEAEKKADVKSILIERMGWPKYLREAKSECIDESKNDIEGTLEALYISPTGERRLVATCPTGRVFAMGVPSEINSCDAARNWLAPKPFRILART
jgi:hypothetical protein